MMRMLFTSVTVLMFCLGSQAMGQQLTGASIRFHTDDDDKDNDTHVTVTVQQNNQIIAARIDNDFGKFDNNSDSGPFSLVVVNPVAKKTDLQPGGSVTIRIDPKGNDTWQFNFFLDLVFSDGSHLNTQANGLELSDERPQQTFGIP
jgi:hypothetical protein